MRNSLYPILFCLLLSFACDEKNDPATACGVADPVEDLTWLAELKEDAANGSLSEYSYIVQAKYKGQRVFYVGSCCPFCNWAIILYDCSGETVAYDASDNGLTDQTVIWQPENSECTFD